MDINHSTCDHANDYCVPTVTDPVQLAQALELARVRREGLAALDEMFK